MNFFYVIAEENYRKDIQILANNMSGPGMGAGSMRKDQRDRNDRGSMPRGGSMSGSGYNNSNKLSRGAYQDNDGWIQTGGNKNRGGNNSTSFDPNKFRVSSVSKIFLILFSFERNSHSSHLYLSLWNFFFFRLINIL